MNDASNGGGVSHIMVSLNSLKHIFNWLIQKYQVDRKSCQL
jgi:hypothetical protein